MQQREAKEELKAILDNTASCLFLLNVDGVVEYMNLSAEETTGFSIDELFNKNLHDFLHHSFPSGKPYPREDCPVLAAFTANQRVNGEDVYIKKDGSYFPVKYSMAPFERKGKKAGAVLEFQDITKQKELERQKDDFIGIASHELKTPVTSIKAYAQVLGLRFKRAGDFASQELIDKMDAQLNKLTYLISDLLDVTKIESGKLLLQKSYFDYNELVEEITEEVQHTTQRHTILMDLAISKKIYGDRYRIGQVLTNLMTNAIKYSPHSDKIIIRTTTRDKDKTITTNIQDFGVGIPFEKLNRVFERFYRVGGTAQQTFAGLGLGLYISSEIIKRHHGGIWVDSVPGQGSNFYFSLPTKFKPKTSRRPDLTKESDDENE